MLNGVGIREVEGQNWLASFLNHDLGLWKGRVEPAPNPFLHPGESVNRVTGMDPPGADIAKYRRGTDSRGARKHPSSDQLP